MHSCIEAFLDIETTGLSPEYNEITVVGINLCRSVDSRFDQFIGEEITADNILESLDGVNIIYTYNGSRFDLPFIHSRLGIDLATMFSHYDLMYTCWRNSLAGGLKCVERQLGIPRRLTGISGYEAIWLWWKYVNDYDEHALSTLREYNKEDVINLKILKEKLIPTPTIHRNQ